MPRDRNPSLSKTCLICRQKLTNQLKLNSSSSSPITAPVNKQASNREDNVNKISQWKALCLESFSMLFGLPVNHPFISVFANSSEGSLNNKRHDGSKDDGSDIKGQLCNRCLQDVGNVQFVFWQFHNLEKKLSELQILLFDRLRANYEALPVALLFGKYIGVETLREDVCKLKYDEVVKILYEEIKSVKNDWPKPFHTARWKQACQNSEQLSHFPDDVEKDNEEQNQQENVSPDISGNVLPPQVTPLSDLPLLTTSEETIDGDGIKIEVDHDSDPGMEIDNHASIEEPNEFIIPDKIEVKTKSRSSKRKYRKKVNVQTEEKNLLDDNSALTVNDDGTNNDSDWIPPSENISIPVAKKPSSSSKRKRSLKKRAIKTKLQKKPAVVNSSTDLEKARFLCTEDPENCCKTYGSKKYLRSHVEKFHKARKFICEELGCSAKFQSAKSLALHTIRTHEKKRPKEICEICGLEYSPKEMRKHYYFRHQGIGKFKCERCSMDFMELELFQEHEKLHDSAEYPFLCVVCQKLFTNSMDLKSHVTSNHLSSGLKCSICGIMKPNEFLLQRHLKIHDRVKRFTCAQCGKQFSTQAYLRYHEDHFHTNADRKFPCEVCGKEFKHEKNVMRHLICHQEEKPFKCKICLKTFNYSHLLKKHEEIHSGTKNYECHLCGKRFRQEQNLRQHMKSHRPKPERTPSGRKRAVKTEGIGEESVGEISYEIHQDVSDKDAVPVILQVKSEMGSGVDMNINTHLPSCHHSQQQQQFISSAALPGVNVLGGENLIEATIIPAAEITEDEHGNPTGQYETVQEIQLHHSQDLTQSQTATVVFLYEYNV